MNLQEIILDIMYHKLIYLYDDIKDDEGGETNTKKSRNYKIFTI